MTLLTAMAVTQGVTRLAKTSKAVIIRKNPRAPGGREQIPVDLKKVLMNHAPDQQLVANDILFVPESSGKRTLDTIVGTVISTSIWRVPY
jgi:hypothetical protein